MRGLNVDVTLVADAFDRPRRAIFVKVGKQVLSRGLGTPEKWIYTGCRSLLPLSIRTVVELVQSMQRPRYLGWLRYVPSPKDERGNENERHDV